MEIRKFRWDRLLESARKEEVRKRASGKRESDEHSALVVSASLDRVSALGKTKRKKAQNFQFEYPFSTADICFMCCSDSPVKERGKKCTVSASIFLLLCYYS